MKLRFPTVRLRGRRSSDRDLIPLGVATRAWFRVSLQTFGGPAGQIAVMHRELVEERRWIGERRFLHALSYCTLLPGPEAQQLAIYLGWLLNGTLGGLIAGVLFVLPGYLAIMALSVIYAGWGDTLAVEALFADTETRDWGPLHLNVPHIDSFDPVAGSIATLAFVLIFRRNWSVLRTLGPVRCRGRRRPRDHELSHARAAGRWAGITPSRSRPNPRGHHRGLVQGLGGDPVLRVAGVTD